MFCKNCGKELPEGSMFCPDCGANLTQQADAAQPEVPAGETPAAVVSEEVPAAAEIPSDRQESADSQYAGFTAIPQEPVKEKKGKAGLIIGVIAAVAAAALAVCFATGVFSNPKADLASAVNKTAEEYNAIVEDSVFSELLKEAAEPEDQSVVMSLGIRSINGAEELNGLGLSVAYSENLEKEKMNLALTPFYGSADIITLGFIGDGSMVYAGSPQLLDGKYAALDTMTLGQDLQNQWGVSELSGVSFNAFELGRSVREKSMAVRQAAETLEPLTADLATALTVEKGEKESVSINDVMTECVSYQVHVPEKELSAYVEAVAEIAEDAVNAVDPEELLLAMGFSDDIVDDLMSEFFYGGSVDFSEDFDAILTYIAENEGLDLTCFVADGYLKGVRFADAVEIEGDAADLEVLMEIGSQSMITQTLSFTANIETEWETVSMRISSNGDHAAATTLFLDDTVIAVNIDGEEEEILVVSTEYDTKTGDLSWTASMPEEDVTVALSGNLTATEDTFTLADGQMTFSAYGEEAADFDLSVLYTSSYTDYVSTDTSDVYLFADMDESDWQMVAMDLYGDIMTLAGTLDEDFLNLLYMFF